MDPWQPFSVYIEVPLPGEVFHEQGFGENSGVGGDILAPPVLEMLLLDPQIKTRKVRETVAAIREGTVRCKTFTPACCMSLVRAISVQTHCIKACPAFFPKTDHLPGSVGRSGEPL